MSGGPMYWYSNALSSIWSMTRTADFPGPVLPYALRAKIMGYLREARVKVANDDLKAARKAQRGAK
jgi:hypothetical protein